MNIIAQKLATKNKSQSWLAKKCGLNRFYLNKIIKGKIPRPSIHNAYKIAKALDCIIEDLWIFKD